MTFIDSRRTTVPGVDIGGSDPAAGLARIADTLGAIADAEKKRRLAEEHPLIVAHSVEAYAKLADIVQSAPDPESAVAKGREYITGYLRGWKGSADGRKVLETELFQHLEGLAKQDVHRRIAEERARLARDEKEYLALLERDGMEAAAAGDLDRLMKLDLRLAVFGERARTVGKGAIEAVRLRVATEAHARQAASEALAELDEDPERLPDVLDALSRRKDLPPEVRERALSLVSAEGRLRYAAFRAQRERAVREAEDGLLRALDAGEDLAPHLATIRDQLGESAYRDALSRSATLARAELGSRLAALGEKERRAVLEGRIDDLPEEARGWFANAEKLGLLRALRENFAKEQEKQRLRSERLRAAVLMEAGALQPEEVEDLVRRGVITPEKAKQYLTKVEDPATVAVRRALAGEDPGRAATLVTPEKLDEVLRAEGDRAQLLGRPELDPTRMDDQGLAMRAELSRRLGVVSASDIRWIKQALLRGDPTEAGNVWQFLAALGVVGAGVDFRDHPSVQLQAMSGGQLGEDELEILDAWARLGGDPETLQLVRDRWFSAPEGSQRRKIAMRELINEEWNDSSWLKSAYKFGYLPVAQEMFGTLATEWLPSFLGGIPEPPHVMLREIAVLGDQLSRRFPSRKSAMEEAARRVLARWTVDSDGRWRRRSVEAEPARREDGSLVPAAPRTWAYDALAVDIAREMAKAENEPLRDAFRDALAQTWDYSFAPGFAEAAAAAAKNWLTTGRLETPWSMSATDPAFWRYAIAEGIVEIEPERGPMNAAEGTWYSVWWRRSDGARVPLVRRWKPKWSPELDKVLDHAVAASAADASADFLHSPVAATRSWMRETLSEYWEEATSTALYSGTDLAPPQGVGAMLRESAERMAPDLLESAVKTARETPGALETHMGFIRALEGGDRLGKWDGDTRNGITQVFLEDVRDELPGLPEKVTDLTPEQVDLIWREALLRSPYYDLPKLAQAGAPDSVLLGLLDAAVQHGRATAVKQLQSVLRRMGRTDIRVDGLLGPKTTAALLEAVAQDGGRELMARWLRMRLTQIYAPLSDRHPEVKRGWANRLRAVAERAGVDPSIVDAVLGSG